jgi:KDO2-lipid IV(A) lauroyltransferase
MYYLLYGFLYVISLLPLRLLYFFSDALYGLVYYVIGYRKTVTMKNLKIAFPAKTDRERIAIAKKFYKNLCDTVVETIKLLSVNEKFLKKHFTGNYELSGKYYESGRSAQLHLGHNFNWELANLAVPLFLDFKTLVVYMPLENKIFDRLLYHIRTRFKTHLLSATNMHIDMREHLNTQYVICLVADQKPAGPQHAYWINFFGMPTPFLKGPEKAARYGNLPVFFAYIKKYKRGYYQGYAELATDNPKELPPAELTKRYAHFLEKVMTDQPETWLWSHNKWKWEWKPEYGPIIK